LPPAVATILVTLGLFALSVSAASAQNATPTVTITPEPDARRLELEVEEFNDSGVSGTATLIETGDQTIVQLDLEDTGENHPAYIHPGSCDNLQPEPAFLLQNVGPDGQSTSVVDASLEDLIAGDFAVNLRIAPNELGTIIVCADIEGDPQVATPVATPGVTVAATQTPEPTATATVTATPTAAVTATPSPTETPAPTATATVLAATETPTQPPAPTETQAPTATATEAPTQPPTATAPALGTPIVAANVADAAATVIAAAADIVRAAITAATTGATEAGTPITVDTPGAPAPPAVPTTPEPATVIDTLDGTGGAVNDAEDSASLPLPATTDLDISGTATLTEVDGNTTRISVVLSGDDVAAGHILHLHDGTCDEPGDFTLDLNPVDSEGISETDVDLSLEELIADGYFINVHLSDAAYGTRVVCGELTEATGGIVVPEVAPDMEARGGEGDETPIAEAPQAPDDRTPPADVTQVPDVRTPIAQATTPPVQTPRAGVTIGTTPEPTAAGDGTSGAVADADAGKGLPVEPAVPTAVPTTDQVTGVGDGTSGDVGDSDAAAGKGDPVDPLTGLPRSTGTGPLLPRDENGMTWALRISSALALLAFAAAVSIRRAGSRPSATTRPLARWTRPDI